VTQECREKEARKYLNLWLRKRPVVSYKMIAKTIGLFPIW